MYKITSSTLSSFSLNVLRFLFICAGSWLAAVEPANHWAEVRQAANAAAGNTPNMDPGVMVIMAQVFIIPILAVVLLIELTRSWALGGKPLSLPSYLVLGVLAACPVGYSIGFAVPATKTLLFLASALGLASFYFLRWAWLASRAKPG